MAIPILYQKTMYVTVEWDVLGKVEKRIELKKKVLLVFWIVHKKTFNIFHDIGLNNNEQNFMGHSVEYTMYMHFGFESMTLAEQKKSVLTFKYQEVIFFYWTCIYYFFYRKITDIITYKSLLDLTD